MQVAHHGVDGQHPALPARERDLAHEAVGGAVEQLLVLHEQALQVRPERPRDAHGGLQRDGARMSRADLDDDPAAVFSGLGDVCDHGVSAGPSAESRGVLAKFAAALRERFQLVFDHAVDGAGGEAPVGAALAGLDAREDFYPFVDGTDGVDGELAVLHRLHHVLAQHQVLHVGPGDQHALLLVQPPGAADVEEALDLLVDAADRLHLALLVDRAGDGQRLPDRRLRQGREQRVELRRGRAVAVHAAVGLLEDQRGGKRQRHLQSVAPGQEPPQDHHALGVQRAAELGLALDVGDAARAQAHARRDAARPAEGEGAELDHGEAVDLPDPAALGIDQHDVAADGLLGAVAQPVGALDLLLDGTRQRPPVP